MVIMYAADTHLQIYKSRLSVPNHYLQCAFILLVEA